MWRHRTQWHRRHTAPAVPLMCVSVTRAARPLKWGHEDRPPAEQRMPNFHQFTCVIAVFYVRLWKKPVFRIMRKSGGIGRMEIQDGHCAPIKPGHFMEIGRKSEARKNARPSRRNRQKYFDRTTLRLSPASTIRDILNSKFPRNRLF